MGFLRMGTLALLVISSSVVSAQGSVAAAISLQNTDGQLKTIERFSGKVSIIHFWATWCSSCLTELPQLIKVTKTMQAQGLSVILIATDSHNATRRYLQEHQLEVEVLIDQYGKAMRDYGVQALPTSVFIDARGNVIETQQGRIDWSSTAVQNKLDTLLSE